MSEESESLYLSSKFNYLQTHYPSTDRSVKTLTQLNQTTAIQKKLSSKGPRLKVKLTNPSSIHPATKSSSKKKYKSAEEEMIMNLIGMRSGRNRHFNKNLVSQPNTSTRSILKPKRSPSPSQKKRVSFRDVVPNFEGGTLNSLFESSRQLENSSGRGNKFRNEDFRKRKATQLKKNR